MNKEQLKKLAEIAGYEKSVYTSMPNLLVHDMDYKNMTFSSWQPHKDIAQAFEVLEGLRYEYGISTYKSNGYRMYLVDIEDEYGESSESADNLPEAICRAVLWGK